MIQSIPAIAKDIRFKHQLTPAVENAEVSELPDMICNWIQPVVLCVGGEADDAGAGVRLRGGAVAAVVSGGCGAGDRATAESDDGDAAGIGGECDIILSRYSGGE